MFLHPHILWLLIVPALLLVWQLRGSFYGKNWWVAVLRALALGCLVVALARPMAKSKDDTKQLVAVVDISGSMDKSALEEALSGIRDLGADESLRLVVFDSEVREVSLRDGLPSVESLIEGRSEAEGSALGEALILAGALCGDDGEGVVHLFSDGRETSGDATVVAASLGKRGIGLVTNEVGVSDESKALLVGVDGPGSVAIGEGFVLGVKVEAGEDHATRLQVQDQEGGVLAQKEVSLLEGMNEVTVEIRSEKGGLRRFDVVMEDVEGEVSALVQVERTVMGVIESAPGSPASGVLGNTLGEQFEVRAISASEVSGGLLRDVDLLVMADVPVKDLSEESQDVVMDWVENGGGLLVSGGKNAFGPGGYAESDLGKVMPLRFPQKKEARDPATALAVIIDTSGSMGYEGVSLAKEVARLALKRLKPHDKAGIVEFHGAKRWAAPMQTAANSIAIQRALNRLSAGGGTVMFPALEEAHYGLLNVRARTKHVLVLTDGGVETGAFEGLLRGMADDGIQVSTVLVGPRAGSGFLAQLASWGRGQFYSAPSRFQLPEVIFKQPSGSLLDPFVEKDSKLQVVMASRLTEGGALDDAPSLGGYVKTQAKKSAEVLLKSEQGDPVLARWHYGLGRVAVLTTALGGRWSEGFLKWEGASKLLANLSRQLIGVAPEESLRLVMERESGGVDLGIYALTPEGGLASGVLKVSLKNGSGEVVEERLLSPSRAFEWSTRFDTLPGGQCVVEVSDREGKRTLASGGIFVPEVKELTRLKPDSAKLGDLEALAKDFSRLAVVKPRMPRVREWWQVFAVMGLIGFVFMILMRRLPLGASGVSRPAKD